MTIGRNDPCPCGSGKKYKKCCLSKDWAAARLGATGQTPNQTSAAAQAAPAAADQPSQQEPDEREWKEARKNEASPDALLEPEPEDTQTASESQWPPISEADQRRVKAWWEEVGPIYLGKQARKKGGWLLERTLAFLDEEPRLFRNLDLHDEFLLELGGCLADAGRTADYLALLRRLRSEQPETYFEVFGYLDHELLAEALRTRQLEDIPACLTLFRQHPVKFIDELARVVDLLAWRGCEKELGDLLQPTALTITESPEVIGGVFALQWLTYLAIFPFLEAGDDSPATVNQLWKRAIAVGYLVEDRKQDREWLARAIRMASRTPGEAGLDLKASSAKWFHDNVAWNFTGWVHRMKGLPWSSARFLADALLEYWSWKPDGQAAKAGPFGLNEARLDRYLAQRCRDIIGLHGGRVCSTLQAFHYFTEYLVAHDYLAAEEARRLQKAAALHYEMARRAIDSTSDALQLYPTYETLIHPGAPVPPAP